MGVYLNSTSPYMLFQEDFLSAYFVDKSEILSELVPLMELDEKKNQMYGKAGRTGTKFKDRRYALNFDGKLGEEPKCTGRILAVGIAYNRKDLSKRHECKIEILRERLI